MIDNWKGQYKNYVSPYLKQYSNFFTYSLGRASSKLTKSTNVCESFHAHFKSNFNHSHPNIFMFIDTLKNIQSEIYIKLQSIHKPNSWNNNKLIRRQQLLN
jgi:hypothetical protein